MKPGPSAERERRKRLATLKRVQDGHLRPAQHAIVAALEQAGVAGLQLAELSERSGRPLSTVRTECQVLRRCVLIQVLPVNNVKHWFVASCTQGEVEQAGYLAPHALARVRSIFELGAAL
jgi:hypothetical protein